MSEKVLFDTNFLSALANKNDDYHERAKIFGKHFIEKDYDLYLSTIVLSEYTAFQPYSSIPKRFRDAFKILTFTPMDAKLAGEFLDDKAKKHGTDRNCMKDDLKILAHVANNNMDYLITSDRRDCQAVFKYLNTKHGIGVKFLNYKKELAGQLSEKRNLFTDQEE